MQRRRSHTLSILLGTGAKTALPADPFRLGFIRLSRVLWLSLLVVMLGGLLEPEAAAQTVLFGAKTDFGTGTRSQSIAVGDFNGDGTLDLAVANPNSSAAGFGSDSATVSQSSRSADDPNTSTEAFIALARCSPLSAKRSGSQRLALP